MAKGSKDVAPTATSEHTSSISNQRLQSFVSRVERLEGEKSALSADIKEVYSEAKAVGYDPKIMRKLVALRKIDTAQRQEQEALLEVYMNAMGMLATTPLGQSAIERVAKGK